MLNTLIAEVPPPRPFCTLAHFWLPCALSLLTCAPFLLPFYSLSAFRCSPSALNARLLTTRLANQNWLVDSFVIR